MIIGPLVAMAALVPLWLGRDVAASAAAAGAARAAALTTDEATLERQLILVRTGLESAVEGEGCSGAARCASLAVDGMIGGRGEVRATALIWLGSLPGLRGSGFWLERPVTMPGDPYPNPP